MKIWSPNGTKLSLGGIISLIVLTVALDGCNYSHRKVSLGGSLEVRATRESIQQDFVGASCLRCHSQATTKNRQVDLTDIMTLTQPGDHTTEAGHHHRVLILPGCPKQSLFLSILKEGKMPPPPDEKISPQTLLAIENWIISLRPDPGTSCNGDEPGGPDSDSDEPG